jgi:hypothetical protein
VDFRLKQFDFMVFEVEGVTEFFFGLGGVGYLELFAQGHKKVKFQNAAKPPQDRDLYRMLPKVTANRGLVDV